MVKHVVEHTHSFDFAEVETLTNEGHWTRRVVKESLYTSETQGRAINDVKFKLNIFRQTANWARRYMDFSLFVVCHS